MPTLFSDFVEGSPSARAFFSPGPDAAGLLSCAASCLSRDFRRRELTDILLRQAKRFDSGARSLSNIEHLRLSDTVVVCVTMRPGLFGGPLAGWLKALTAVRLADWLTGQGILTVPLIWLGSRTAKGDSSVGLLAREEALRFELDQGIGRPDTISERVECLLKQVASALDVEPGDSELLQALKTAYAPGTAMTLAWSRAVSNLLAPWGLIVVDPRQLELKETTARALPAAGGTPFATLVAEQERRLREAGYGRAHDAARETERATPPHERWVPDPYAEQNLLLPVAAEVIGEDDAYDFALDQAIFPALGSGAPVPWPRISATLVDARSRKVLSRYGLRLEDLLSGPQVVGRHLMERVAVEPTLKQIEELKVGIEGDLHQLSGFASSTDKMQSEIENARRRMNHQVEKLATRFTEAQKRRGEAIGRQVERLCRRLAPWGGSQEQGLSGFQFLHHHSSALLETLYRKCDLWKFEHQLIDL